MSRWIVEAGRWMADAEEDLSVARDLLDSMHEVTGKRFDELIDDAKLLDKHYSPPRYPNLHPSVESPAYELYTRRDTESCLLSAERVLENMRELLRQLSVT